MRILALIVLALIFWSILDTVNHTCGNDTACQIAMESPQ
jgi:hypothetical protein